MAIEIVVPQVSDGVTSGTVTSLAVAVGDEVTEDQTLLELETDKAVVAIPSPQAGKISEIRVAEGDQAEVGSVIMLLEAAEAEERDSADADQDQQELPAGAAEQPAAAQQQPQPEPAPQEPRQESSASTDKQKSSADQPPLDLTRRRSADLVAPAAPSVRRIARELGVDIYQVQGSGPGGRISETDVREFVRSTMEQLSGGTTVSTGEFRGLHAQRPLPDFSKWGEVERQPLSRIRQVTADAMGYAWSTIPMVTQYDGAAVDGLERFRQDYNRRSPEVKLTMTAILLKVSAMALNAFPQVNTSLDLAGQELIYKQFVHVGVAVDTDNGLLVPVVRDADRKGIRQLAADLNALAEKARARKLSPDEMDGGTFTISNLGGIGGNAFTPIVYAPQVAILGVSRTETRPVWNGQEFVPQQVMPLSLSYDHRVIDGADGARFLRWICEALEQPLNLVM
ncbi:2-oxo acid dehydrogenase subunit E2 [Pelovirga terrestris]|uniref:Dihydrolipoamide acetyltransferase component of pyruvate dehydrogenase complex n=1 Tax=Pelovirga terrestris TaxID=2771352 RepID=A0A8J6QQA8_9BACT|nr:2-oxo acid dehydrogenase subunit E2 [Pelovirga terrestris]MBD1401051.1 2-oxo acid dehydrogenase subunit E2 [Pelovirga terrestris]